MTCGDLVRGDSDWGSQPDLFCCEFSRSGENEEKRVWVSSPAEMPHLGCLGCSAFWEAGTQGAEAGIAS